MNGLDTKQAAYDYLAGGLSLIPIRTDGSKAPACATWDEYKVRLPTEAELDRWFTNQNVGLAIVGGSVSGNLSIIDHEFPDIAAAWVELVEAEAPGLIAELPQVITPGKSGQPGKHFYFRSRLPQKTHKLAKLTAAEAKQRVDDERKTTAIELKAEGGYCLAPGCPASCHESGRLYRHVGGPYLEETPVLDDGQVEILLSCARALDHAPTVEATRQYVGHRPDASEAERPGDLFNRRAEWGEILEPHGWTLARSRAGVSYWRRPGKDKGVSATTGHCVSEIGGDLLCVFSSNADPLTIPNGKDHACFSKFAAYALLNHEGNFLAAAKDLAGRGYGYDVGMTSAEAWAGKVIEEVADLEDAQQLADAQAKLWARCQEKKWGLSPEEVAKTLQKAKGERIQHDPKLLSRQVQHEVAESVASPPPNGTSNGEAKRWHLIIIGSDPPEYLLKAPFWASSKHLEKTGGYLRLTVKQLSLWSGLRDAALEQAACRPPDKISGWAKLLQRLLDHAEERESGIEDRRKAVVLEFLFELLHGAREMQIGEDGKPKYGVGNPQKYIDGRTIFKLPWLVSQGRHAPDQIERAEILSALKEAGAKMEILGPEQKRSRWWTCTPEVMARIEKYILSSK